MNFNYYNLCESVLTHLLVLEAIDTIPSNVKKDYINDDNFLVPEKTLAFYATKDTRHNLSDVIESLVGHPNRDWFSITAFSFCLPLTIANQYGFVVKSNWDAEIFWDGNIENPPEIKSEGWQNHESIQPLLGDFANGIITLENKFIVRTPRDTNLPPAISVPKFSRIVNQSASNCVG